jgi:hypothetical protein
LISKKEIKDRDEGGVGGEKERRESEDRVREM